MKQKNKLDIGVIGAAAASRFSHVRLCATPRMAAHQAPLSLGFSRQEHWSGLPFPSPMHESEKWKWSLSVVSDPQWPHGLQPSRLLRPWGFPGKSTRVGCHCLPWGQQSRHKKKLVFSSYHLFTLTGYLAFRLQLWVEILFPSNPEENKLRIM